MQIKVAGKESDCSKVAQSPKTAQKYPYRFSSWLSSDFELAQDDKDGCNKQSRKKHFEKKD
jgi:hypothetical protein